MWLLDLQTDEIIELHDLVSSERSCRQRESFDLTGFKPWKLFKLAVYVSHFSLENFCRAWELSGSHVKWGAKIGAMLHGSVTFDVRSGHQLAQPKWIQFFIFHVLAMA